MPQQLRGGRPAGALSPSAAAFTNYRRPYLPDEIAESAIADLGRPFRVEWSGGDSVTVLLPHRAADRLVEADLELVRQLEEPR